MVDSQVCVNCSKKAPETDTNYTLISAQFGWRLTRYKRADGSLVLEWRCPSCWREFKRTRTVPPPPPGMSPEVAPGPAGAPARSSAPITSSAVPSSPSAGDPSGTARSSRRTPR